MHVELQYSLPSLTREMSGPALDSWEDTYLGGLPNRLTW